MYYKRLLIANRGEIAVRIIRTAHKLGISTLVIYSDKDKEADHVRLADEAYPLKGDDLLSTYLDKQQIIKIAVENKADAIHPGYGFLAENPEFAKACSEANIDFVGPDAKSIELMGNKVNAREFAVLQNLPVLEGIIGDKATLLKNSSQLQFPILVKAAAGGGGKGMRIVRAESDLESAILATSREAEKYFGDGEVLLERYIENPRHIEVQVLADKHGNAIHLFERECSIQRRFQKIIEEAPSASVSPELRQRMGNAAVRLTQALGYSNAGTIEFLMDENNAFYFLEMNTRIQVEHPVTEMITGIDLVEEQLAIASGKKLRYKQGDIVLNGHAIEARIYAEDPEQDFIPAPGYVEFYREPVVTNTKLRVDSSLSDASMIYPDFDPMISKLIVWDESRDLAIEGLKQALSDYHIHGIKNNIHFLKNLIGTDEYNQNQISTHFCKDNEKELLVRMNQDQQSIDHALFYAAFSHFDLQIDQAKNIWEEIGYWRNARKAFKLTHDDKTIEVISRDKMTYEIDSKPYRFEKLELNNNCINLIHKGKIYSFYISKDERNEAHISCKGILVSLRRWSDSVNELFNESFEEVGKSGDRILAPLPGKVVKINVKLGEKIQKSDVLLILESMKMENSILAPFDAVVSEIVIKEGEQVKSQMELIKLIEA
ncbi:ATP-grasp domain-containing protein [Ancylomarina euxinus]|uniref:ATP-grasp domain-containing protein n=1 Tax=Ancylomarina euxinus TaxID=2283627 RepID=A0A425XXA3_9BACT|nr:biotin carboxylase N-terminal domain-containing protein [Ancylomarina euxinus]MCZ4696164.1 ATP-grasp domain-containing protein [Ancylomarina euxinus]MUP16573.1 ATP-grasp domain-containing protein [Ancylomarina euxinus]RRG19276.1 ATP-grasp domain-containing protein [Ancylomarina euxinus]